MIAFLQSAFFVLNQLKEMIYYFLMHILIHTH